MRPVAPTRTREREFIYFRRSAHSTGNAIKLYLKCRQIKRKYLWRILYLLKNFHLWWWWTGQMLLIAYVQTHSSAFCFKIRVIVEFSLETSSGRTWLSGSHSRIWHLQLDRTSGPSHWDAISHAAGSPFRECNYFSHSAIPVVDWRQLVADSQSIFNMANATQTCLRSNVSVWRAFHARRCTHYVITFDVVNSMRYRWSQE